MRRKVRYRDFTGQYGFDATATNTHKEIVFSDIERKSYYGNAEEMRNNLLQRASPSYSNIDARTREGRKHLILHLESEIDRMEDQIEYNRLLIQMCRKKNVSIRK